MKSRERRKHTSVQTAIYRWKGTPFPVEAGISLYVPRLQGTPLKLVVLMVKD